MQKLYEKIGGYLGIVQGFIILFFIHDKFKSLRLMTLYSIGFLLQIIFNAWLKTVIKQKRPSITNKQIKSATSKGSNIIMRDGFPYEIYGMPSGHATISTYSTLFSRLVINNNHLNMLNVFLLVLTLIHRYVANHHTLMQLLFGTIIGIITTYFYVEYVVQRNKNKYNNNIKYI